jgi:hypothetical protein
MNETLDKSVIAMNELINLPVFLTLAEKYGKAHMGKPASCTYIFLPNFLNERIGEAE